MTRTTKILVLVCGGAALLGIVIAVATGWFVYSRKDAWLAEGKLIRTEGLETGRASTESACLEMALSRYKLDPTRFGGIRTRVWLSGCLESSLPARDFCADVPATEEIAATVAWRLGTCGRHGFESDTTCANVLTEVQTYCHGEVKAAKTMSSRD
jgi:hypothetical protein